MSNQESNQYEQNTSKSAQQGQPMNPAESDATSQNQPPGQSQQPNQFELGLRNAYQQDQPDAMQHEEPQSQQGQATASQEGQQDVQGQQTK